MKHHLRYLSYVIRHKWFVFRAGLKVGCPLWQLIIHDWSKFLPSEWIPYATHFYSTKPIPSYGGLSPAQCEEIKQRRARNFDRAWLLHQNRNPHHWQYWILIEDDNGTPRPLDIPKRYALEMVADWAGAGRAITGRWEVSEWYDANAHRMVLSPLTRIAVEDALIALTGGG